MSDSVISGSEPAHRSAVILAGGSGTRLWPLSRRSRPKQLLKLFDGRSLMQEAYGRLRRVLPAERIFVIALEEHLAGISEQLPELPPGNLIGEPEARDTANAVALSAGILHASDPQTVMGVFTADQLIRPAERFVEVIARGYGLVESRPETLVTFGVKPATAHTGMGYLHRGESIAPGVWRVRAYKEKPDEATARAYVADGAFFWNSGMFVWRTATILEEIARHLPETAAAVQRLARSWKSASWSAEARRLYPGLRKISIDYAVMEKAPDVAMLELECEWLDVGHWSSLWSVQGADAQGNARVGGLVATLVARNNLFVSEDDHLIVALGVEDLVVVHSADATLVCRRDQLDRLKEVVARLEQDHGGRFA